MSAPSPLQYARFFNEFQAAKYLGISPKTLRRWRVIGNPPNFLKFGKSVKYAIEDLDNFIEASRRVSTTDCGGSR